MPSNKVFDRAMFQASSKPLKADSGIMQGFDEQEDEFEVPEDEMFDELSKRKPNSPEILMNNLRGDMRSVDARYQELAEMVGEEAAMDTPPEVLALLQAQMAQQASGIGALPAAPGMTPPPSMPPPAAPMPTQQAGGIPQPQDMGMPPVQMAHGGEVYYPPAENVYSKYSNFTNGVAAAGRNGDTMLAHITPEQEAYLTMLGDGKTTNPHTGLPEHFLGMANLASRGGNALYNMGANIGQRAMPYLQAADAYAGRALFNPVLTAPTVTQSRSTLGTFGPKVVEGMELVYPTLTQRIGQVAAPVVERVAQAPAVAKAGAALTAIPGAAYVRDMMGGKSTLSAENNQPPVIPGDPATGWVPEEEAPQATPIDYSKLPVTTTAAPATETETKPTTEQFIKDSLAKKPTEGRLEAYMEENLPIFEKYLGGDKDYSQSQALFLLADAGLELATKRGRTGAMSIANAFKKVPAGLSSIGAQEEQARRSVRGAALTAGLQQIAAEDKATAALQKALIEKMAKSGELKPSDLGAGLTSYTDSKGQPAGMRVEETVTKSFLDSRFTPQLQKDKEGNVVGFDTPYARVGPNTQTINLDKDTRTRLAGEISRQELALSKLDDAIQYYTDAFGPKAFFSNLKNNVLVPVTPLDPNLLTEKQRTKIMTAMNTATKAIARAGDTGNIAVAEQNAAKAILGDEPGKFFSDYQTALQRIMTVRTDLANQRLNTAAQLGWINQDIQLDVPNIGTPADPIPQDKLGYLKSLKTVNPNGQVYVNINGKSTPVLLSTLKD